MRAADGEEVKIDWIRGHDPVFELVSKAHGRTVETVPLASLAVAEIDKLLEQHGFLPRVPSSAFRARLASSPRSRLYPQLRELLGKGGAYTRAADGENVSVSWKQVGDSIFELTNKETGQLAAKLELDLFFRDPRDVEVLLAAHGFLPPRQSAAPS